MSLLNSYKEEIENLKIAEEPPQEVTETTTTSVVSEPEVDDKTRKVWGGTTSTQSSESASTSTSTATKGYGSEISPEMAKEISQPYEMKSWDDLRRSLNLPDSEKINEERERKLELNRRRTAVRNTGNAAVNLIDMITSFGGGNVVERDFSNADLIAERNEINDKYDKRIKDYEDKALSYEMARQKNNLSNIKDILDLNKNTTQTSGSNSKSNSNSDAEQWITDEYYTKTAAQNTYSSRRSNTSSTEKQKNAENKEIRKQLLNGASSKLKKALGIEEKKGAKLEFEQAYINKLNSIEKDANNPLHVEARRIIILLKQHGAKDLSETEETQTESVETPQVLTNSISAYMANKNNNETRYQNAKGR